MMSLRISKYLRRRSAASGCPLAPLPTLGQKVTKRLPHHFAPLTLLALIIFLASMASATQQQSGAVTPDLLAQAKAAEMVRDFPRAAECYVTYLNVHSDSAEIWQRLGLVYYLDNRYDHAAPALQQAVELDPSLWGANLFLGISEYRMGQFDRAQESDRKSTR